MAESNELVAAEDAAETEAPPVRKRHIVPTLLGGLVLTLIAGAGGAGLGIHLAATVEEVVTARVKALPEPALPALKYDGDMVLQSLKPVIANLGDPTDTWLRLETAIVFENGALPDPHVTAADIEQDIVAYARTVTMEQLAGPSALQHLREDLNERVAVRTNGLVTELIITTLVVQ